MLPLDITVLHLALFFFYYTDKFSRVNGICFSSVPVMLGSFLTAIAFLDSEERSIQ